MRVFHVPVRAVPDWFGDVREYLERACEVHGFLDVEDVHLLLSAGRATLTIVVEDGASEVSGCFVTEWVEFPKKAVVNIVLVGGTQGFLVRGFEEGLKELEQKASDAKADALTGLGRPGWVRVARRLGWQSRELTSVWKELGGGQQSQGRRQRRDTDDADRAVDRSAAGAS